MVIGSLSAEIIGAIIGGDCYVNVMGKLERLMKNLRHRRDTGMRPITDAAK